jgi:4-coumarate--CoA ligase
MTTTPQHLTLSESAVLRILRSLISAELAASGRRIPAEEAALWPADLALDESGLGLDSLERLACAAAVNAFFHLHETGIEDYLLARRQLGGWAEVVRAALAEGVSGLTVASSGSTDERRPCTHPAARLLAEGAHWAGQFAGRHRIFAFVPPHHIYGFLFTALLPDLLGLPVLDARTLAPGRLLREVARGDLLVSFPTGFATLLRSIGTAGLPADVEAVSSTAPLPAEPHRALRGAGAARVMEVYGSSETGGIATRLAPEDGFCLLPWWRPGEAGQILDAETGHAVPLPDHAAWDGKGRLRLHGRKDHAVQVGGVNVYPARIAARLREHPLVADCAVRLDSGLAEPRLKAFAIPAPGTEPRRLALELEAWCRTAFAAPERPVRVDCGPVLPVSELGKPADWEVAA